MIQFITSTGFDELIIIALSVLSEMVSITGQKNRKNISEWCNVPVVPQY